MTIFTVDVTEFWTGRIFYKLSSIVPWDTVPPDGEEFCFEMNNGIILHLMCHLIYMSDSVTVESKLVVTSKKEAEQTKEELEEEGFELQILDAEDL